MVKHKNYTPHMSTAKKRPTSYDRIISSLQILNWVTNTCVNYSDTG